MNVKISILEWDPNTTVDFNNIPAFDQEVFVLVYRSKTSKAKKMDLRSVAARFLGMKSDVRLFRVYIPSLNRIRTVRGVDFRSI